MKPICEIRCEAYALKAEYAKKYGKPFKAFANSKQFGTEVFFADTQTEAFAKAYDYVQRRADGRTVTVAHFRSDKFKKIYTIWSE